MLLVVIPVFILTAVIAWKFRASNSTAKYTPDWDHHTVAEVTWWAIPAAIILVLAIMTWNSSHTLEPSRPLTSVNPPLTIQVVALQWKWLFIYPEQNIATVGYVQFPKNTPVNFQITADAPMNSFWIPQLGGQIYAMAGMKTSLHLMADEIGKYNGSSANLSGVGFAGMKFTAEATTQDDFDTWVQSVGQSPNTLNLAEYQQLAKPSTNNQPAYYTLGQIGLYDEIVMKYMAPLPSSNSKTMAEMERP